MIVPSTLFHSLLFLLPLFSLLFLLMFSPLLFVGREGAAEGDSRRAAISTDAWLYFSLLLSLFFSILSLFILTPVAVHRQRPRIKR